ERRAEALGIDLRFRPVPDRLPTRGQDKVGAREAIDFAKAHCTERDSLVRLTQLRESAFLAAIGQASTAEVEKELARQVQVGEILIRKASDGRELATTKSALAIETRILSVEAMGRGKVVEITSLEKVERAAADAGLSDEQTAAVATALLGRNRVVGIEGRAGTGKTTTMRVVQGLSEEAGWKLVGLGAQGSAVKALDEAGIQAQTIQSWLPDTNATDAAKRARDNSGAHRDSCRDSRTEPADTRKNRLGRQRRNDPSLRARRPYSCRKKTDQRLCPRRAGSV
ncbi:MAG: AAA family ATPase, partial [Rhodocyclaceae bacterium]|nr:AAA family ATPase [Rhodocyclaceae bacterium]